MGGQDAERKRLEEEIAALERELTELRSSLPKHSVKASQVMRIEELEDQIAERRAELEQIIRGG